MGAFCKIKKVCGFYISDVHLAMMILPYINKEINENKEIITFFENDLENNIKTILSKWKISKDEKEKILKINWNKNNIFKYTNLEKMLKNKLEKNKEINIFIAGSENYINIANENINKFLENNKLKNEKIKIINCYQINEFNNNIKNILDFHDMIFNTSGEHGIEEIFEGYKRKSI